MNIAHVTDTSILKKHTLALCEKKKSKMSLS